MVKMVYTVEFPQFKNSLAHDTKNYAVISEANKLTAFLTFKIC